jgi:hypothetical protein
MSAFFWLRKSTKMSKIFVYQCVKTEKIRNYRHKPEKSRHHGLSSGKKAGITYLNQKKADITDLNQGKARMTVLYFPGFCFCIFFLDKVNHSCFFWFCSVMSAFFLV